HVVTWILGHEWVHLFRPRFFLPPRCDPGGGPPSDVTMTRTTVVAGSTLPRPTLITSLTLGLSFESSFSASASSVSACSPLSANMLPFLRRSGKLHLAILLSGATSRAVMKFVYSSPRFSSA